MTGLSVVSLIVPILLKQKCKFVLFCDVPYVWELCKRYPMYVYRVELLHIVLESPPFGELASKCPGL